MASRDSAVRQSSSALMDSFMKCLSPMRASLGRIDPLPATAGGDAEAAGEFVEATPYEEFAPSAPPTPEAPQPRRAPEPLLALPAALACVPAAAFGAAAFGLAACFFAPQHCVALLHAAWAFTAQQRAAPARLYAAALALGMLALAPLSVTIYVLAMPLVGAFSCAAAAFVAATTGRLPEVRRTGGAHARGRVEGGPACSLVPLAAALGAFDALRAHIAHELTLDGRLGYAPVGNGRCSPVDVGALSFDRVPLPWARALFEGSAACIQRAC